MQTYNWDRGFLCLIVRPPPASVLSLRPCASVRDVWTFQVLSTYTNIMLRIRASFRHILCTTGNPGTVTNGAD